MSKRKFDGEVGKAWEQLVREIRTRRTVSINTIAAACERENDPRWMQRIQNVIPDFVEALLTAGVQVVAVNRLCVKRYAEIPVTDQLEALRCVQLRGGGGPAAGIRRALPDDLVLEAHIKSIAELSGAGVTAAIATAIAAEREGTIPADGTATIAAGIQRRIGTALSLPAAPRQASLPE